MTENAITLSDFVIKATLNEGEGKNPPLTSVNKESMPLVQSGETAEKTNDRLIKVVTAEGEGHNHAPTPPDQPDDSLIKAKTGEGEGCTLAPSPPKANLMNEGRVWRNVSYYSALPPQFRRILLRNRGSLYLN